MKKLFSLSLYVLILSSLFTCQEIYNNPSINGNQEVMVVVGLITDDKPCTVQLSKAIPFNEKDNLRFSDTIAITGAIVTIRDNEGYEERLTENFMGQYKSKIIGTIGKTYTLQIHTPDGNTYESLPCRLHPKATIDSLYASRGDKKVMVSNSYGGYEAVVEGGMFVYSDITSPETETSFYRIETRVVKERFHQEWRQGRPSTGCAMCLPTSVYCWYTWWLSDVPAVKFSFIKEGKNAIRKFDLGFIVIDKYYYFFDPVKDPPTTIGYIVSCNVYAIDEDSYLYYKRLGEQLNAGDRLFDPIPTQLPCNITCTSDKSKIVIGNFEAASRTTKHYFMQGKLLDNTIRKYEVYDIPDVIFNDCQDDVPPNFWKY